jgi:hypothetical protein
MRNFNHPRVPRVSNNQYKFNVPYGVNCAESLNDIINRYFKIIKLKTDKFPKLSDSEYYIAIRMPMLSGTNDSSLSIYDDNDYKVILDYTEYEIFNYDKLDDKSNIIFLNIFDNKVFELFHKYHLLDGKKRLLITLKILEENISDIPDLLTYQNKIINLKNTYEIIDDRNPFDYFSLSIGDIKFKDPKVKEIMDKSKLCRITIPSIDIDENLNIIEDRMIPKEKKEYIINLPQNDLLPEFIQIIDYDNIISIDDEELSNDMIFFEFLYEKQSAAPTFFFPRNPSSFRYGVVYDMDSGNYSYVNKTDFEVLKQLFQGKEIPENIRLTDYISDFMISTYEKILSGELTITDMFCPNEYPDDLFLKIKQIGQVTDIYTSRLIINKKYHERLIKEVSHKK